MTVILNVDVARNSGWCITVDRKYHSSGEVDVYGDGPAEVCQRAVELDKKAELVLEQPSHGNRTTLVSLGAARGTWLLAWARACGTKSPRRYVSVFPATWRSKVFQSVGSYPLREKLHAQLVTGRKDVGPDEAAAVCISTWATMQEGTKGR